MSLPSGPFMPDPMPHADCGGSGVVEEYGEFSMRCDCEDGVAICSECGDYATRVDDEGRTLCDPHYFAHERELAA